MIKTKLSGWFNEVAIESLIGETIISYSINENRDEIKFKTKDGQKFSMLHMQDCCENVYIEDICGDLDDLVNSPIVMAERVTNSDNPPDKEYIDSFTWTFFKFGTNKGSVTIRWLGESNGYYGEDAVILLD